MRALCEEEMDTTLKEYDVAELTEFLLSKDIPVDVVENFKVHGINGQAFLQLSEDHLREVAPRIVDRLNLKGIASKAQVSVRKSPVKFAHSIRGNYTVLLLYVLSVFHISDCAIDFCH